MPINSGFQTKSISSGDFHLLDYDVMSIVFSIHKELGRFWNEKIYQNELAYRCEKAGLGRVTTEVPIRVSYQDFIKIYYIDLLINNVIYELKTTQTLTGEHEKQTINYLMLTGLNYAKLINMRPSSVQHRFVSTNITQKKRYDFTVDDEQWKDLGEASIWLRKMFKSLLNEWGVFLETSLFYEAIVYLCGGDEKVNKEVEVRNGSRLLGRQRVHLITSDLAFMISAVTKEKKHLENHFRRFIRCTPLKAIHWINFDHNKVLFKTLCK